MIDKLVVSVFIIVLSLFLAMQLLIFGLALFRQQQLDMIGHKYALIMDREAGLDPDGLEDLGNELLDAGFSVQSIHASPQGEYGQLMQLQVEVSWPAYRMPASLLIEEVDLLFSYDTEILCRRLIN